MNLAERLQPLPPTAVLQLKDWLVWGASMVRTDDGTCHLYFSRWPRNTGHSGWVTHSEVAYATASDPLGPYTVRGVALGRRGRCYWDADVAHNPTILAWQGRYYLYYTGNHGNGEYWNHRNNQRIGVAISHRPEGPWKRLDSPVLDVNPGAWDSLITTNPSCTVTPEGRFLLVYKAAESSGAPPRYGPVRHGVATADTPVGPFRRSAGPIFVSEDAFFACEDPFVWHGGDRYYAIVKDMGTNFSESERALVLFQSMDGCSWSLAPDPVVCTREIRLSDGTVQRFHRLERPQLYLEDGKPRVLFCAVKPDRDAVESYNIHIPIA